MVTDDGVGKGAFHDRHQAVFAGDAQFAFRSDRIEHVLDRIHEKDLVAEALLADQHDFPALLAEFDRVFALLRRANAAHGDMKISNFIYQSNRLCVLDLDAMQPYKRAWQAKRAYRKDVERFRRNWAGSEFEGAVETFLDDV